MVAHRLKRLCRSHGFSFDDANGRDQKTKKDAAAYIFFLFALKLPGLGAEYFLYAFVLY